MSKIERDENREERIIIFVVVDAYDEEERASGDGTTTSLKT
jgi:hypothetical protein